MATPGLRRGTRSSRTPLSRKPFSAVRAGAVGEKIQAWKNGSRSTVVVAWALIIHSSTLRLPGAWRPLPG